VSFPEYFSQLAKVCKTELNRDFAEMNCKFIATFLGPDTDGSLRTYLQQTLGTKVYDNYGINETALGSFECTHQCGLHIMEDLYLFEIVDTETGQPLPDGQTGNIVVTSLCRTIPPIIRLNTRDLGRIIATERCECGSHFKRMDHFLGRSDDMVRMRGVNIYPMRASRPSAAMSVPPASGCASPSGPKAEASSEKVSPSASRSEDRRIARGHGGTYGTPSQGRLGVRVVVELVDEGALAEFTNFGREGKARRLLDLRRKNMIEGDPSELSERYAKYSKLELSSPADGVLQIVLQGHGRANALGAEIHREMPKYGETWMPTFRTSGSRRAPAMRSHRGARTTATVAGRHPRLSIFRPFRDGFPLPARWRARALAARSAKRRPPTTQLELGILCVTLRQLH